MITRQTIFTLLHLIFGSALFFASAPSFAAEDIDFLIVNGRLHLVGQNLDHLKIECESLGNYSEYIRSRNGLEFKLPIQCGTAFRTLTQEELQHAYFPTYSYDRTLDQVALRLPIHGIDVSDLIPSETWSRHKNSLQDTVCYNSALVESGIFPLENYSVFHQALDHYLSMQSINISHYSDSQLTVQFGPKSDLSIVADRKTWQIQPQTTQQSWDEIQTYLKDHFGFGNVLCVDKGDLVTREQLVLLNSQIKTLFLNQNPNGVFESNIGAIPSDYFLEQKGGHCFTLLTPSLVSEANKNLPHNLVNFKKVFQFVTENLQGPTIVHYFRLDHSSLQDFSKRQLEDSKHSTLLSLAKKHHRFYETLHFKKDQNSSQVNLYGNPNFFKNDPKLRGEVLQFWESEILPTLHGPLFNTIREAYESNDPLKKLHNDSPSYQIYQEMMDTYKQLFTLDTSH